MTQIYILILVITVAVMAVISMVQSGQRKREEDTTFKAISLILAAVTQEGGHATLYITNKGIQVVYHPREEACSTEPK